MSTGIDKYQSVTKSMTADQVAMLPPETQSELLELDMAMRWATVYAQSTLVPKEYQNNIGNVLIAKNMANRLHADLLMVMQNLYVVYGRPGWSSQFLIATFNQCGRFSAIKYKTEGIAGQPKSSCTAYTKELSTGEEIIGPKITWEMANAEGWVNKSGSKWKTMPDQMFRYRAASFMIRCTAPELAMGLPTKEELEDMAPDRTPKTRIADLVIDTDLLPEPPQEPVDQPPADTVTLEATASPPGSAKPKQQKSLVSVLDQFVAAIADAKTAGDCNKIRLDLEAALHSNKINQEQHDQLRSSVGDKHNDIDAQG